MVSRGAGRSAVAAAAYLSCSRMLNEYDGVQHDYTRKQGLGWRQVFLPATAPAEWQDRETLWNAVEETETTKALLYSTAALSLFAASHVHADETSHWTARSVDQIKADISVNDNQQTYTVQYGDTLGSIVEAMGIDMNVLANIKEITNIDLIFPGTVLTTTYNADNQAVSVKVETPSSETSDTPVVAESNLTTNEVTVNGQSVVASDLSAPVETVSLTATQAPAKEESTQVVSEVTEAIASASDTPAYADTEQPVADAIDHVTSSAEETLAEEEAPATETSAQAETTEVAATSEAASEAASDAPAENN